MRRSKHIQFVFIALLAILTDVTHLINSKKIPQTKLIFTDIQSHFDPEYLSRFVFKILPKSPGRLLNLDMHVRRNFTEEIIMALNLSIREPSGSYKGIFVFDMDICRILNVDKPKNVLDASVANILSNWVNNILKYGNMLRCPLTEGDYELRNLRADKRSIPPFATVGKYRLATTGYLKSNLRKKYYYYSHLDMDLLKS